MKHSGLKYLNFFHMYSLLVLQPCADSNHVKRGKIKKHVVQEWNTEEKDEQNCYGCIKSH